MKQTRKMQVGCPGCKGSRIVNACDWATRKSDYCKGCSVRVRVGLKPSSDPSEKGTPLHNIWCGMRQRCGHKKGGHAHDVKHYAERGIVVCDEWRQEFRPFKEWAINNGFQAGLLLDRRENDIGYQPDNCRFVTYIESNRNKRTTLTLPDAESIRLRAASGTKQCVLAKEFHVTDATISNIVRNKTWR
jgi:hypothetical protein